MMKESDSSTGGVVRHERTVVSQENKLFTDAMLESREDKPRERRELAEDTCSIVLDEDPLGDEYFSRYVSYS